MKLKILNYFLVWIVLLNLFLITSFAVEAAITHLTNGDDSNQESAFASSCPNKCLGNVWLYNGDEAGDECIYEEVYCSGGCFEGTCYVDQTSEETSKEEDTTSTKCTETDEGIDFNKKGSVQYYDENNKIKNLYDHCEGNTIVEYLCNNKINIQILYKDCFEENNFCKDAVCVPIQKGECMDSDGFNTSIRGKAYGTNQWNEEPTGFSDYCSNKPEGRSSSKGIYIHEAICNETQRGYFEVQYAEAMICEEACEDGACKGKALSINNKSTKNITKENTIVCPENYVCMTQQGAENRFGSVEKYSEDVCEISNIKMYCFTIKNNSNKITRLEISTDKNAQVEKNEEGEYVLKTKDKEIIIVDPEKIIASFVKKSETLHSIEIINSEQNPVYDIKKVSNGKILGIIPVKIKVSVFVDAKRGMLIKEKPPWWNFLTVEEDEIVDDTSLENKSIIIEEKNETLNLENVTELPDEYCGDKICNESEYYTCSVDCGSLCGNGACDAPDLEFCPEECELCKGNFSEEYCKQYGLTNECGNGLCEILENQYSCPIDCNGTCGNDICEPDENNSNSCMRDCHEEASRTCGNGKCEPEYQHSVFSGEDANGFCISDCCGGCGDGICKGGECTEDYGSCPYDCGLACGDGKCEGGEGVYICPEDCEKFACGNRICEPGESPESCPQDCAPNCGDGKCELGEGSHNHFLHCDLDCGSGTDNICSYKELIQKGYRDCDLIHRCGNGICEGGESFESCPDDCNNCIGCDCGNGICEKEENETTCPGDCIKTCGNSICDSYESTSSCEEDCLNSCGDGICDEKDLRNGCEQDCSVYCGDEKCDHLENQTNCPTDCPLIVLNRDEFYGYIIGHNSSLFYDGYPTNHKNFAVNNESIEYHYNLIFTQRDYYCGDGVCNAIETRISCHQDCQPICGDGVCGGNESYDNCKLDCGQLCGNNICRFPENKFTCLHDCRPFCGDGLCNKGENPQICPLDCGSFCGNDICEPGESTVNCPIDCVQYVCGNGVCDPGENPQDCNQDCGSSCGDSVCEGNESYKTCPWDCGYCGDNVCDPSEKELCIFDCVSACGNNICESDETSQSCPYDCSA